MAQIGTVKVQTQSGVKEIPVFETGDVSYPAWRVQTPNGIGAVNLVDPSNADLSYVRVQTPNGVKAVSTSVVPDSGMSYYSFDGDANDSWGSNDATVNGAALTSTSITGQAYEFDGGSDYISHGVSHPQNGPMTMAMWFKPNDATVSTKYGLISTGGAGAPTVEQRTTNYQIKVQAHDGSWQQVNLGDINTSEFFFLCAVFDPGNAIEARLYSESSGLIDSGSTSLGSYSGKDSSVADFGRTYNGERNFGGIIDEVRFYSKSLRTSEQDELYQQEVG